MGPLNEWKSLEQIAPRSRMSILSWYANNVARALPVAMEIRYANAHFCYNRLRPKNARISFQMVIIIVEFGRNKWGSHEASFGCRAGGSRAKTDRCASGKYFLFYFNFSVCLVMYCLILLVSWTWTDHLSDFVSCLVGTIELVANKTKETIQIRYSQQLKPKKILICLRWRFLVKTLICWFLKIFTNIIKNEW